MRNDLDIALCYPQIPNPMKIIELIAETSPELGIDISPAEFERGCRATPGDIFADPKVKGGA